MKYCGTLSVDITDYCCCLAISGHVPMLVIYIDVNDDGWLLLASDFQLYILLCQYFGGILPHQLN